MMNYWHQAIFVEISSEIVSLGDFGVTITISVALTFSFYLTRKF